jgi:hypothetical protein
MRDGSSISNWIIVPDTSRQFGFFWLGVTDGVAVLDDVTACLGVAVGMVVRVFIRLGVGVRLGGASVGEYLGPQAEMMRIKLMIDRGTIWKKNVPPARWFPTRRRERLLL